MYIYIIEYMVNKSVCEMIFFPTGLELNSHPGSRAEFIAVI